MEDLVEVSSEERQRRLQNCGTLRGANCSVYEHSYKFRMGETEDQSFAMRENNGEITYTPSSNGRASFIPYIRKSSPPFQITENVTQHVYAPCMLSGCDECGHPCLHVVEDMLESKVKTYFKYFEKNINETSDEECDHFHWEGEERQEPKRLRSRIWRRAGADI